MDRPAEPTGFFAGRVGDLGEDVHRARVEDGVDGVQPQAIDVELTHPRPGVLHEVAAHAGGVRTIEVDGLAPRRLVAIGEEGPELRQVVALGPQVVVDNIQDDAQIP